MDTFQIATDGINPNWTPWLFALKGFGFEVEVIVTPPQPKDTGGGWAPDRTAWDIAEPYTITVRIRYKGKSWEQKKTISALAMRSMEKVMSSYRGFRTSVVEVFARINNIIKQKINVRVTKVK